MQITVTWLPFQMRMSCSICHQVKYFSCRPIVQSLCCLLKRLHLGNKTEKTGSYNIKWTWVKPVGLNFSMKCSAVIIIFAFIQVERSCSFLEHLILIQQEQRAAAYEFEEHIRRLRKFVSLFKGLHSNSITCDDEVDGGFSLTPYQHASFKCMWRQKVSLTLNFHLVEWNVLFLCFLFSFIFLPLFWSRWWWFLSFLYCSNCLIVCVWCFMRNIWC